MRKRNTSEEQLFQAIEPTVEGLGVELVDLKFEKENTKLFLRIYLDKRGGISIDELEEASLVLDPLVTELGHTRHDYFTVSSPGLDRPLETDKDLKRHLNEDLSFKFHQSIDGEQVWEAELLDFDADTLTLKREGHETSETIPRNSVAEIKQLIRF